MNCRRSDINAISLIGLCLTGASGTSRRGEPVKYEFMGPRGRRPGSNPFNGRRSASHLPYGCQTRATASGASYTSTEVSHFRWARILATQARRRRNLDLPMAMSRVQICRLVMCRYGTNTGCEIVAAAVRRLYTAARRVLGTHKRLGCKHRLPGASVPVSNSQMCKRLSA